MLIRWRLAEVLDEREMTPLQLAQKLGVKHPSVYRMAAQKDFTRITEKKLRALCKALDCEPGDLITYRKR